jgi:hypothetical protein
MAQAGHKPLPEFDWAFVDEGSTVKLTARANPPADAMRVWSTQSESADLRRSDWKSQSLRAVKGEAEHRRASTPAYQAFFIEAEFRAGRPAPLYLSTTMRLLAPTGSDKPQVAADP